MKQKLVEFLCCNTAHLFTQLREFKMCECGKSGFDAGDGIYCRTIGTVKFEVLEEEHKQYLCNNCGELSECSWECDYCQGDDLTEYEE